jgi:hypothetical protein
MIALPCLTDINTHRNGPRSNLSEKSFEQRGCKTQSQASGIGRMFMLVVSHDDVPMMEAEISGGFWTRTKNHSRNFATGRANLLPTPATAGLSARL